VTGSRRLLLSLQLRCGLEDQLDGGARPVEKLGADGQQIAGMSLAVGGDVPVGAPAVALDSLAQTFKQDGAAELRHHLVVELLTAAAGEGPEPVIRSVRLMPTSA